VCAAAPVWRALHEARPLLLVERSWGGFVFFGWPMVIFAAATGLRPSELFGLEQRDVDRQLESSMSAARTPMAGSSTRRRG
jgi:hypothetical protein